MDNQKATVGNLYSHIKYTVPFKMKDVHYHDVHELYYLANGKTTYFIGDELILLEAGDMVFIPKGSFHKTDYTENTTIERIIISFDDKFAGEDFLYYINSMKKNKLIKIPREKLSEIEKVLNKLADEETSDYSDREIMQKLCLRELLVLIFRYRTEKNKAEFTEYETLIQKAAKYISKNYNADLSLNTLAKKYAVSPCHFSRLFKSVTGVGLNEYINISKISAAEKILSEGNVTITEVALKCGFNDSNYFASVFKKLKGISPKKFSLQKK